MKGLLMKDLRITLQNKKLIALVLLLAVMLTITQNQKEEGAAFVISYVTMIFGTLVLNTISVDEFDKSIAFLMTMPIDKSLYATEKYIFALGGGLVGCMISSVFCAIAMKFSIVDIVNQAILIYLVLSLFQMVLLPVQLKFGGDVGRMVLIGIVVAFILLCTIASKVMGNHLFMAQTKEGILQLIQKIASLDRWVILGAAVAIWMGCLFSSVVISKNIMKKKEF